ncbi:MAG: glucose-6-phosphate dehydrogenase [Anaerolineae bacterium]
MTTGADAPATLVIFGASGDLTQRKLVPALFSLHCAGFLPGNLEIAGVARSPLTDEEFRRRMLEGAQAYARLSPGQCARWDEFAPRLHYHRLDYEDGASYQELGAVLEEMDRVRGVGEGHGRRLFYLATPPALYVPIIQHLGASGLSHSEAGWVCIVVEKPFGHDLPSARALNVELHRFFAEEQIYRIDHYLGKETVQNLLVFRFANTIFEPLWNRTYIDHVQITVAESIGVGHRAGYYDKAGVLRDMFQNHLIQLLTLTTMEPAAAFDAKCLRDEKAKVLRAVRTVDAHRDSVRGQYRGYREEPGIAPDSRTATYGALRLYIDNWRWRDVPFFLRSGKRLAQKASEILIQFKAVPHLMFDMMEGRSLPANSLAICIQPDEGFHLYFEVKVPGAGMRSKSVNMEYHYAAEGVVLPDAYERLLLDALQGDASLFARADEIERSWELIDPIAAAWEADEIPLYLYEPGSWGPAEADALLAESGRRWRLGCQNAG